MSAGRIVTRNELAELLDVDLRTVDGWLRRGCPIVSKGGRGRAHEIDSADVVRWLQDRAAEGRARVISLDEARLRKTIAEAGLAELELDSARRMFAPIDMVAEVLGTVVGAVSRSIEALPAEVAPSVAAPRSPAACRRLLEDAFAAALEALSSGPTIPEVIRCPIP